MKTLQIRTTKGHLTCTEKRHINALFAQNMTSGKVNRKTYFLNHLDANKYSVNVCEVMTRWIGEDPKRVVKYHEFEIVN